MLVKGGGSVLSRIVCCGDAINRDGRKGGSACRRYCSGCSIVVPCDLLVDVAVSLKHDTGHTTASPKYPTTTTRPTTTLRRGTVVPFRTPALPFHSQQQTNLTCVLVSNVLTTTTAAAATTTTPTAISN